MRTLLILLLLLAAHGNKPAPPPPLGWFARSVTSRSPGTTVTQAAGDVATCVLPAVPNGAGPLSFVVTTSDPALLGDKRVATASASIALSTTGSPAFTYWGSTCSSCNPCTGLPASVRLFFSTRTDFSTSYGDEVWYSNPLDATLATLVGSGLTLSQSLSDPSQWSNGQGINGSAHSAAFTAATSSVCQVGLAFGGGCFFDVGVGVVSGTGTATLHLTSYTMQ